MMGAQTFRTIKTEELRRYFQDVVHKEESVLLAFEKCKNTTSNYSIKRLLAKLIRVTPVQAYSSYTELETSSFEVTVESIKNDCFIACLCKTGHTDDFLRGYDLLLFNPQLRQRWLCYSL